MATVTRGHVLGKSPGWNVVEDSLGTLAAFLVFICMVPFLLPIILVFYLYLTILRKCLANATDGQATLVEQVDALWLQDSRENMAIINALILLKGKPDIQRWQKAIFTRLVDARDESGRRMFPKMMQNSTRMFRSFVWVPVERFDIRQHCFLWNKAVPKSKTDLQSILGYLCSQPFPENLPRWQIILLPSGNKLQDTFYVILRLHHSIADGTSITESLLTKMVDVAIEKPTPIRFASRNTILKWMKAILTGPSLILRSLTDPLERNLLHGAKLSGDKILSWSEQIDLNMIKRMKQAASCTVNDVLFSCLASAIRDFFRSHSSTIPTDIHACVPVDLRQRTGKSAMNNRFAMVFIALPLYEDDPVRCLARTKSTMDKLKSSAEPLVNAAATDFFMTFLPHFMNKFLFDMMSDKSSMTISNVPGPQQRLFICGSAIEDIIFWPVQRSGVGMGISIMSYNGHVKVGIITDRCILSNPHVLVKHFEENVNLLAERLGVV